MNKIFLSKIVLLAVVFAVFMMPMTGCGSNEPQLVDLSQQSNNLQEKLDSNKADNGAENEVTDSVNSTLTAENTISVHISGAVVSPGLYEVPEGSRLYDGVMAAGGFTRDAAVDYSNLAEVLLDGVKYHIYTEDDIKNEVPLSVEINLESHYNSVGQLNINLATKEELMELDGIGESKAKAIIDYRDKNGAFKGTKELENVSGIGEGLYSRIVDLICVN